MIEELGAKKKNVWQGNYKGIGYEVCNWQCGGETVWNYYIYLNLSKLKPEVSKQVWLKITKSPYGSGYYSPYNSEILKNIEMHGGITYYSKYHTNVGSRGIKVGCDFSHLDDHYTEDDLDTILLDLKKCIDTLPEELNPVKETKVNKGE